MTFATILLVADEPQIRRVMCTTLASEGHSVVEAKCGDDALLKLRHSRPDLILLDVNMSGIRGLNACREMRSASDVPIIMLTVRNIERDKVMALDAGADDYVVKAVRSAGVVGAHPRCVATCTLDGKFAELRMQRAQNRF